MGFGVVRKTSEAVVTEVVPMLHGALMGIGRLPSIE